MAAGFSLATGRAVVVAEGSSDPPHAAGTRASASTEMMR
jgi:hypothetical protein